MQTLSCKNMDKCTNLVQVQSELLLVRGAFLQLPIKCLNALLQLLPVPADLGQTGFNASRLARRHKLGQRLGVCLQLRKELGSVLKFCSNTLRGKNVAKSKISLSTVLYEQMLLNFLLA